MVKSVVNQLMVNITVYFSMTVASFPGRFGREKRPGNFREFKLLLPLPELEDAVT